MNAENPSMSKFQLVTQTQLPHRCLACGKNADGKIQFLDFGLSLDTEDPLFIGVPDSALGVIYICEDCGREAAAVLGCLSPQATNELSMKFEELISHLETEQQENDRLRTLNESYINVLSSLGYTAPQPEDDSEGEEQGDSVPTESESGPAEQSAE